MSAKYYFIALVFFTLLVNYSFNVLLKIEDLVVTEFSNRIAIEQLEKMIDFQRKWEWLAYIITPLFLLIKTSIIAGILDMGCFFFNKEIKYKTLFHIVVKAEFVFLLVIVFKTVWFYVFQQEYTLEDIQYFYPLSALNIVGYNNLQPWFIYPLQILNLFELAYWFMLAYYIDKATNTSTDKGFEIVAYSYGPALLLWVVAVMFFTLNMS